MKQSPLTIQEELSREYRKYKKDINKTIHRVLNSGRYILGKELERFEERFADLVGTRYAVGVGNGFDALYISLMCINKERVYVCNFDNVTDWNLVRHISTYNAPHLAGYLLVDKMEDAEVVIPTIYPTHNNKICKHEKIIVEDACQAIGMKRKVPDYVTTSCYSFHPLKVLHCYGDGGAIALNDEALYNAIKTFRNHGRIAMSEYYGIGVNSRLDEIQAAVLNVMMDKLKGQI